LLSAPGIVRVTALLNINCHSAMALQRANFVVITALSVRMPPVP